MKMNYAAEHIAHIYKQVIKEEKICLSKLNLLKVEKSYGDFIVDTKEVFTEFGDPKLKYEYVGHGRLRFMGNINGKVHTQGLYYKNEELKKEVETFVKSMDVIFENKTSAISLVEKQHGKPKPEHSVIYYNVQNNLV